MTPLSSSSLSSSSSSSAPAIMLALFFPLNLLDVDPDLPDWLFEVWVGGVIDFVSIAVFSFPHVEGLCPAIVQNVHGFFFQMHFPAW